MHNQRRRDTKSPYYSRLCFGQGPVRFLSVGQPRAVLRAAHAGLWEPVLCLPSLLPVWWLHIDSSKSATRSVFTHRNGQKLGPLGGSVSWAASSWFGLRVLRSSPVSGCVLGQEPACYPPSFCAPPPPAVSSWGEKCFGASAPRPSHAGCTL